MIINLKRRGRLIESAEVVDNPPVYNGSILIHEVVVRGLLHTSESLCLNFSVASGGQLTKAQTLKARNGEDGKEYYATVPNIVTKGAGNKTVSIFILDIYEPMAADGDGNLFKVITSANVPFTVHPSNANTDFEPIDETAETRLQNQINDLYGVTQPPDNTDADQVGNPNVSITAEGRLKFSQLKGEPGKDGINGTNGTDGVNGTVQWGANGASPISTLDWIIKN